MYQIQLYKKWCFHYINHALYQKIIYTMNQMEFLKSLEKNYLIWHLTQIPWIFVNTSGNFIDRNVDNDHEDKAVQLAWAWSGFQKVISTQRYDKRYAVYLATKDSYARRFEVKPRVTVFMGSAPLYSAIALRYLSRFLTK